MAGNRLEQTRTLHEDIDRLEHAAVLFLLEEPKNHKESVNQSHRVSQVIDHVFKKTDKLIDIYKDIDNSRKNDIDSLDIKNDFSLFYSKLRDIKEYHRKFPGLPITDPSSISSQITGSENIPFTTEESYGKYLDLHEFHDLYNNLPWMKLKPIDYFNYLKRAFSFNNSLSGKGKQYIEYLKGLLDYCIDFIKRAQPLFDLNNLLNNINNEINNKIDNNEFESKEQEPINDNNNDNNDNNDICYYPKTYCLDCMKIFARPSVFNSHLTGKKHKKSVIRSKLLDKETFILEFKLLKLGEHLSEQISDSCIHVETKLARGYEDIIANLEDDNNDEISDSDSDEEEEMTRRCITNYPVGWDGKPIPYWLYKLHGLGIEYKCEICGNTSYWGRRAFEKHFIEWRHAYGMKCLGIPNSKHFHEITNINDALALWEKVKADQGKYEWNPDEQEEFEDEEGNVMIKKTYLDLKRQGL